MARTAITPSALVGNGNLTDPAGTAGDATNHHSVSGVESELLVIRVDNGDASGITATVKAGANPPALAAGQGDLAVSVGATSVEFIGPLESARFAQANGDIWLDLSADTSVTVTAFEVPRTV